MTPQWRSTVPSCVGLGSRQGGEQVWSGLLVTLMLPGEAGKSLESLILPPVAPILTGFDPGCWVVEQITGDASHCALGQEILRGKVLMVWRMTQTVFSCLLLSRGCMSSM